MMGKAHNVLTVASAISLLAATAARADVYIALQEAGVNGGALTQVATGDDFASWSGQYGAWFNVHNINITNLADKLASTALDLLGTAPRTLFVYVSSTDQTGLAPLLSGLTSNILPVGGSVTLSTFVDAGNGIYATTTALASHTFDAIGAVTELAVAALSEPYSVTGVYEIHSPGHNLASFADTIKVSAVPEPSTLGLLGGGLVWLGLFFRRSPKHA